MSIKLLNYSLQPSVLGRLRLVSRLKFIVRLYKPPILQLISIKLLNYSLQPTVLERLRLVSRLKFIIRIYKPLLL
jgi:hypothetical protein